MGGKFENLGMWIVVFFAVWMLLPFFPCHSLYRYLAPSAVCLVCTLSILNRCDRMGRQGNLRPWQASSVTPTLQCGANVHACVGNRDAPCIFILVCMENVWGYCGVLMSLAADDLSFSSGAGNTALIPEFTRKVRVLRWPKFAFGPILPSMKQNPGDHSG